MSIFQNTYNIVDAEQAGLLETYKTFSEIVVQDKKYYEISTHIVEQYLGRNLCLVVKLQDEFQQLY